MLETDDEAIACLTAIARRERLGASQFTAIGAFRRAVLGYFEWEGKEYRRNPIEEQVEVASLVGDVSLKQGREPGCISTQCSRKRHDPESGLALGTVKANKATPRNT